jgi:signal peptidase I
MEWLVGLNIRMVFVLVGCMLVGRACLRRPRQLPELIRLTLLQCSEIALVSFVAVFLMLHRFGFQLYFIPSGSMIPTLAIQDRIVVNKWIYHLHPPHRGDVVVFHAPPKASDEPMDFVKRVVGLPGETISVVPDTVALDGRPLVPIALKSEAKSTRDGLLVEDEAKVDVLPNRVVVNGQPLLITSRTGNVERLGQALVVDGQVVRLLHPGEPVRCRPVSLAADGIRAPGIVVCPTAAHPDRLVVIRGHRLTLQRGHVCVNGRPLPEDYPREAPRYAMAPIHVTAGHYLVFGDNRNNSKDSHFWGSLNGGRIVGRADAICWPPQRAGLLGEKQPMLHAGMF